MRNINLLVVADGIFSFGPQIVNPPVPPAGDQRDVLFTISKFLSILQNSQSPTITVTTAHREGDANATITTPFNFKTSVPDLGVYDVIWLFGDEGTNYNDELPASQQPPVAATLAFIGTDEVAAIAEYMEGGGGVFATGDHEGLGSLMCGLIPRVRTMRAWFSDHDIDPRIPSGMLRNWPGTGAGRADTVQKASDNSWHFDNQSDEIPQPLSFPSGTSHPILQGANGPISKFPDHMHEGQVNLPWTYTDSLIPGDSRLEYPSVAGHQEKPVILATGNTTPDHATPTEGSACEQNNFYNELTFTQNPGFPINTLAAYDGHSVGVGRVVTDSSFHHYLDLNLIGDPCAPPGPKQQGFTTAAGAAVMADLTAFYVNTVAWLARQVKTCTLLAQNSTFGKDQVISLGLPATFPPAFWVVMDGFLPSELGIDASGNVTDLTKAPTASFSIDPPADANATIVNALVTQKQLTIEPFAGQVLAESLPPPPNSPQRFLYPFTIKFTGTDGFVLQSEFLTLSAAITVGGKPYQAAMKLELTTAANPYLINVDAANNYTSWLSTDLRVFRVDDDETFFGQRVCDYYPSPYTGKAYPVPPGGTVPAAVASQAATAYVAAVIPQLTAHLGQAGTDTFDSSLKEDEQASRSLIEFLPVDPRTGKAAYNFAICRVRIRGTTPPNPPPPFTTQAPNCRVFFRAFQAQTTVSTFNTATTYRSTPIVVPDVTTRVPLLGVQTDSMGQEEYVTIPFFAVDRVNLAGPADLTTQPADAPNVQTIAPATGKEIDTYYGCWLDVNQPTPLFPQFAPPGDYDNQHGSFNTPGFAIQSINGAFNKAPHQCLIAEVAFDDVPIPPTADTSTSDKLAQRNLAYIDGPNPGAVDSRRMPHPFQIQATPAMAQHVDELMIAWGNTPAGATASIYLPGVSAGDILALADNLYANHLLTVEDQHTIQVPTGPVTFVPIPKSSGLLAGLLTVDLPPGIVRGDAYTIVVRQVTDATAVAAPVRGATDAQLRIKARAKRGGAQNIHGNVPQAVAALSWRRVLGAFQINVLIGTKEQILPTEERLLALFRWIAGGLLPRNRWYPVMQRYIGQLAGRVGGFGGTPGHILPSPTGYVPGLPSPGHEPGRHKHEDRRHGLTGKVDGVVYDHFGDFDGFIVETSDGERHRFYSRELRILDLVRRALEERIWVTVIRDSEREDGVAAIILGVSPPRER